MEGTQGLGRWGDLAVSSVWILLATTIAGFLAMAGALLAYDAFGGLGPLAALPTRGLQLVSFVSVWVIQPATYAVATWRWGVRGAALAFLGLALVGPYLFSLAPWSAVDSSARYGYYDEGRGWLGFGLIIFSVIWAIVVPVVVLLARLVWRAVGQRRSDSSPAD